MMNRTKEDPKDIVELGKVTGAHGIKGEVRVFVHSGSIDNLRKGMDAFLREPGGKTSVFEIERSGMHGRVALVKFRSVDDRNAAEALTGRTVLVEESELADLPEDTYYLRDLEGLRVVDADSGEACGSLAEVIQGPGQDIYRIQGDDGREALVPAVREFIKAVDLEEGIVRIHFIEGMFH